MVDAIHPQRPWNVASLSRISCGLSPLGCVVCTRKACTIQAQNSNLTKKTILHHRLQFNVGNTFRIVVNVGSCTLFLIRRHRWYPVKKYATAKNITISCGCTLLRSLRMSSFTDCINTDNTTHINQSSRFCFTLLINVIVVPNTNPNHKQITSHYSTTGCQAKCFVSEQNTSFICIYCS